MGTQSSEVGGAKKKSAHSIGVGRGNVDMSEAGVQSSIQALMHSIGTQGSSPATHLIPPTRLTTVPAGCIV